MKRATYRESKNHLKIGLKLLIFHNGLVLTFDAIQTSLYLQVQLQQ
jgi:hypothetical protein